jgi:ABC-type multidrug transport system fused ATPase/permease subunit
LIWSQAQAGYGSNCRFDWSGKSFINLLNRFTEINSGTICIDNENIESYTLDSLQTKLQLDTDVFLFADTIYNNITLNDPGYKSWCNARSQRYLGARFHNEFTYSNYDFDVKERGVVFILWTTWLIAFTCLCK